MSNDCPLSEPFLSFVEIIYVYLQLRVLIKRIKFFTELEQLEYSFIIENAKCEHLKLTSIWHWYAFSAVNKWC